MAKKPTITADGISSAIKAAMQPLTDIRQQIAELTEKRSAVRIEARSRAETLESLRMMIEARAEAGKELVEALANAAQYTTGHFDLVPFTLSIDQVRANLQSMVAFLNRDRLLEEIEAAVNRHVPADRPGLKEATTERERLDREIHALAVKEETMVRELEAAGLSVQRRADANPEIVLADDPALVE